MLEKGALMSDAIDTSAIKDLSLDCAEDNPCMPILPASTVNDDAVLKRLRPYEVLPLEAQQFHLHLKDFSRPDDATGVDASPIYLSAAEYERIRASGRMVFHAMGCSGDPSVQAPQAAVADVMVAAINAPDPPAFCFHLGDVVYKAKKDPFHKDEHLKDSERLRVYYTNEFYGAYRGYNRPIFAIPGNHDGKYKYEDEGDLKSDIELQKSPMWLFLQNFCAEQAIVYPQNLYGAADPVRPTMTQPYPFFVLETPVAFIIGLNTNVCNGGTLEVPTENGLDNGQYRWLVARLRELEPERVEKKRALIIATHYPPFSGAADFGVRGDVQSPKTPGPHPAQPLGAVLLNAFEEAQVWPDLILSAHAHLYQRLMYSITSWDEKDREWKVDREIPCLIVGSGGHGPVESLWRDCAGNGVPEQMPPFPAVSPPGMPEKLPAPGGEKAVVNVVAYNDQDFGVLRVTIDTGQQSLMGEWSAAFNPEPVLRPGRTRRDVFHIPLKF